MASVAIPRNQFFWEFSPQYHGVSAESKAVLSLKKASDVSQENSGTALSRANQDLYRMVLEEAGQCSVLGWDGYDAKPVTDTSIRDARKLIESLPDDLPIPNIIAEPTGELCFEWHKDKWNIVSLSVGGDDLIIYSALFGPDDREYGRKKLSRHLPQELRRLIGKLKLQ